MAKDECTCPLRPRMTYKQLMDEIFTPELYCTSFKQSHGSKGWICPNALKELERARAEERSFKYRKQALRSQGVSVDEIEKMTFRRKRKSPDYAVAIDLDMDGLF